MPRSSSYGLKSIRGKLLAISLGLLVVFLCSVWATGWGLRTVFQAANATHEQTLPRLLQYQKIENASRIVVEATRSLPMEASVEDVEGTADRIDREISTLKLQVRDLPESPARLEQVIDELRLLVDVQRKQVVRLLEARREIGERAQQNVDSLGRTADHVDDLLLLGQSEGRSVSDLYRLQESLLRLVDVEREISTTRQRSEVDELQARFLREFVGLGPSLTRLEKNDSRELAGPLLEAFESSGNAEGLFELARQRIDLEERIEKSSATAAGYLAELEELASEVSDALAQEAADARDEMVTANSQVTGVVIALLIIVCVILIATGLYVQRGILVRLRKMVDELTALSRGELGVRVTPGGDRELAELAEAAEVFRSNAADLASAVDEVEARNAELAQFAYVASHDLKTPLRGISNLASWVIEDCEDLLPDESRDHLSRMVERTQRMENLLEDLLRYSRVGREKSPVEEVQLGKLLREITDFIAPEGGIELEIVNEEMLVQAQRPPLELALRNLLANTRAHSDEETVQVQALIRPADSNGFQLDLIDDGPGIPEKHAEKVFGMFTRLSHDETGTGMGLALVRRIAESMGGSAVVVPRSGRGAHIRLVWPGHSPATEAPRDASSRSAGEPSPETASRDSA